MKGIGAALLVVNPSRPPTNPVSAKQLVKVFSETPFYSGRTEKAVACLVDGSLQAMGSWDWRNLHGITDGNRYNESHSNISYTTFRASNAHRFEWASEQDFQMIYFAKKDSKFMGPFPDDDEEKVQFLVGKFKEAANVLQPEFAVVDDFENSIAKRKGKDLRQFGWGAAVYGPDLVKTIGREKLLASPAYKVEALPWGGVWVQAAKNPFQAIPDAKKAIEKHLGLKAFGVEAKQPPKIAR